MALVGRNLLLSKSMKAETFRRFWAAFADKRDDPAWKAWCRIPRLDLVLAEAIISAAMVYAAARPALVERGGTAKMAEGWLNDRRWEDERQRLPAAGRRCAVTWPRPLLPWGVGDE